MTQSRLGVTGYLSSFEKIAVGKEVESFDVSPQFDAYSGVEIIVDEDTSFFAGNRSGRVLRIENPLGTQAQARAILADLTSTGFQYQPYEANGALLDPAAELGDGVSINGTYSGIYKMSKSFGSMMSTDISAPQDEEIDHEYPYEPKQDRIYKREIAEANAQISINSNAITAEVTRASAAEGNLSTRITQTANSITSEVTARQSADSNLSTRITQTANSITSEVNRATTAEGNLSSRITQNADSISAKVSKTGGSSSTFGWNLTNSSWTVSGNGKTIFKVTNAGAEIIGKITATSGYIGNGSSGFTITSNSIYNGMTSRDDSSHDGVYIGTIGIGVGKGNFRVGSDGAVNIGWGNFRVDTSGNVKANNMTLTGRLNIGGTIITAEALRAGAQSAYSNGGAWSTGANNASNWISAKQGYGAALDIWAGSFHSSGTSYFAYVQTYTLTHYGTGRVYRPTTINVNGTNYSVWACIV